MKTRIYILLIALLTSIGIRAQYVVSDKYDLWFEDSGYEVTTRKSVACYENYQDLWNGCTVRLSGSKTYIYRGGSSILYGDEIILLNDGRWKCIRGNYVQYI